MRLIWRFSCFFVVVLARPTSAEPAASLEAQFAQQFHEILSAAHIPGGAFSIVKDGAIVRSGSFGVRVAGTATHIDEQTVFRIASVSKTFTAQLTAQLVEQGKLDWHDGVKKYLPEIQFKKQGFSERLQLHHILSQSSGLVPNAYDNLLNANQPLHKIYPKLKEIEPLCMPGSCYSYQNVLFSMLEPVVEKVTEESYEQLVKKHIFSPLKMVRSSVGRDAFVADTNHAEPHVRRNKNWTPAKIKSGYYYAAPAAGINASANDLGKWLIAQMGYHPSVITPSSIAAITQKHIRTKKELNRNNWRGLMTDAHYGYGWRIYQIGEEVIFSHSGWVEGFVADIAYSQERKVGLVVLLNAESGAITEATTTFWRAVMAEPLKTKHEKPVKIITATSP